MTGSLHSLPSRKPKKPTKVPGYLLHKPTGQARVRLNGHDHYLGPYGSDESRIEYGKLIAQHSAGVPVDPFRNSDNDETGLTINELTVAFMRHAEKHYRKNGAVTSEVHCFKLAFSPLVNLYGGLSVNEFGPLTLKAVRAKMVSEQWVRKSVNRAVARIRHLFRWGLSCEMVNPMTLVRLEAVAPLQAGRTEAPDNPPRTAVPIEHITAVKSDVSPLVADLIDLQRLIGCRSGELLSLTTRMIDRTAECWIATLVDHKTSHKGQSRFLAIGPQAQLILSKYLKAKPDEPLFEMRRDAFCRAITRSCERLDIPRWIPHQLRHTAASRVREEFDLEHVQATLGHAKATMSETYAKVTRSKAVEVALKIG